MRSINGWRFLLVIALPIFLASLGVLGLTFDLLDRVSSNANLSEYKRNRDLIVQALKMAEADLGRLAQNNAQWDDAYANTVTSKNADWFNSTWAQFPAGGTPYDLVAVIGSSSSKPEHIASRTVPMQSNVAALLGPVFHALAERGADAPVATSFAYTAQGPVIASMARIASPSGNVKSEKQLLMIRTIDAAMLAGIEKAYLLKNIWLEPEAGQPQTDLRLHDAAGTPALVLRWDNSRIGDSMVGWAKQKASAVLSFLILVMTGITVVCWRLIQNLVANEAKARHDALHDPLTGMPNRAALLESLQELRRAGELNYAIAFADLDGFKEVNDSFGHDIGDRLIRAVGAGISLLATSAAMCCRMGGDEFVILFVGERADTSVREFADRLIRFLVKPFDMEGRIMTVGASVGIAGTSGADLEETEILRRADVAMYKAKADGRNRSCVYDEAFDTERNENQAIAAELRKIIANRTLDIVFQPVMDARTLRMAGVEALARWPASSARKITPDRFIGVAETAGLIDELGELILDKACAAARDWPDLKLAVNVSAVQLNNPRFVDRALTVIEAHRIDPRRVELELTETSLVRDAERAKVVFKQLRLAGIRIALDDFGTGFSSIGYLRTFQFDRIKIDKSIVSKVLSNPAELAIVQGTLLVARGLSAEVTAEGVEREAEVAVLRLAGCTGLQGFFFHKPLTAQQITAELARTQQPRRGAA